MRKGFLSSNGIKTRIASDRGHSRFKEKPRAYVTAIAETRDAAHVYLSASFPGAGGSGNILSSMKSLKRRGVSLVSRMRARISPLIMMRKRFPRHFLRIFSAATRGDIMPRGADCFIHSGIARCSSKNCGVSISPGQATCMVM
jgi:hypothetical protein